MVALVDCNSFFCSVEKVFHPGLKGKPVCVLSSNDGCIVALTPEAKALGLRRGEPIFRKNDVVEREGVVVFSSNMYLYAAMSRRIVSILRNSIDRVENYSIDESFCYLDGYERLYNIEKLMRDVANRILLWTDIPVSVGVAPTKTLAKMGSKYAKQFKGYRNVCMIDTDEKRRKALALFDLADVWGIGRQTFDKLTDLGIRTPLEFADKSERWVRTHFAKPTVQTWMELNGHPCIDTTEHLSHQSICTSRSFGSMVSDVASLKASVATFSASCANKLRAQQSLCGEVMVFLSSNRFREDLEQYHGALTYTFAVPTCDTIEITEAALMLVEVLWKRGVQYKKSGVVLNRITPIQGSQGELFDPLPNRSARTELMRTIDSLNQRYGVRTVHLSVEGPDKQPWKVKSERRSPNYLTDIRDILTVKC